MNLRGFKAGAIVLALFGFLTPVRVEAYPYCDCDVKCVYDAGGLCLVGGGSTSATVYWSGTFNYKLDDGDPYGGTLITPADYEKDCKSTSGYAQTGLHSHFNSLCRKKVDWLSYVNAAGFAHEVTVSACKYVAKK